MRIAGRLATQIMALMVGASWAGYLTGSERSTLWLVVATLIWAVNIVIDELMIAQREGNK
jgi:hypothetical protein